MIAGYTQNGYGDEALNLMCQMLLAGIKPNDITIASVLSACANLQVLEWGKQVHAFIIKTGHDFDLFVRNSQITMYADCGSIHDAGLVFYEMPQRDVVSWNAMIAGYAQNGYGKQVLMIFHEMQCAGKKPDAFTFGSVIQACGNL
jgi:pentatricopeptide repeat protein